MVQQLINARIIGDIEPGAEVGLNLRFSTDPALEEADGLNIGIAYNSEIFEVEDVDPDTAGLQIQDPFGFGLQGFSDQADEDDIDNDPSTDRVINGAFADPAIFGGGDGAWPWEEVPEGQTSVNLGTVRLVVDENFDPDAATEDFINVTLREAQRGFDENQRGQVLDDLNVRNLDPDDQNQVPTITPPDAPFPITDDFQVGDEVFTVQATDPDGDEIASFDITGGNTDVNGNGTAAFAIDDEGIVTVQDADDLEADTTFNLDVTATDEFGAESEPITFDVQVESGNQPPEFDQDEFNFDVDENSAVGTVVGTVEVTDPDDDPLNFAIAAGNDDVDGDGELAFEINDQGEIVVNDSDDLDFETQEAFGLTVAVNDGNGGEDEATANITVNNVQEFQLEDATNNLFRVEGSDADPAELRHTLTGSLENQLVEVGLVLLDEGQTTEDALADGANIRSVFSVLPNEDGNSGEQVSFPEGVELSRILSANSERVGYILNNNEDRKTIDELVDEGNLDALEVGGFNTDGDGPFTLSSGELSFTVEAAQEGDIATGAGGAQSQQGLEAFDLSDVPDDVTVNANLSFDVISEADFDNAVGFYAVDNANGTVDGVAPGDDGYADAVLGAALQDANGDDVILQRGTTTADFSVQVSGGQTIVPFLLPDVGNIDELPDSVGGGGGDTFFGVEVGGSAGDIFTPYTGANPEGADHFRLLGDNTFGVEDLVGGGDQDFNDFVFGAEFTAV